MYYVYGANNLHTVQDTHDLLTRGRLRVPSVVAGHMVHQRQLLCRVYGEQGLLQDDTNRRPNKCVIALLFVL